MSMVFSSEDATESLTATVNEHFREHDDAAASVHLRPLFLWAVAIRPLIAHPELYEAKMLFLNILTSFIR